LKVKSKARAARDPHSKPLTAGLFGTAPLYRSAVPLRSDLLRLNQLQMQLQLQLLHLPSNCSRVISDRSLAQSRADNSAFQSNASVEFSKNQRKADPQKGSLPSNI